MVGAVAVASGTNQTFTIAANSGFGILDVLVDGVSQGGVSTYTFNNVTATHTIVTSFKVVTTSGVLFEDNFVYTGINGDSLTNPAVGGNIWKAHSGGGSPNKVVQFQNSSLSFTGYSGSGLGGSINFQNNARSQDVNAKISSNINNGSLYTSFLLKIDSSGGKDTVTDYFYHFCDTSGTTGLANFRSRVFVSDGSSAGKFKIGLSKGTAAKLTAANIAAGAKVPVFSTTEYNFGQTYLVVMKYTFNSISTKDDALNLFVLDATVPTTEPTPTLSFIDTAISDLKQIQSVVIREGSIGRTAGTIDGVKIFTGWGNLISTPSTYNISGNIVMPNGKKINTSTIALSGAASNTILSDAVGVYQFNGLNTGNYVVKASKQNSISKSNGVSAIDVILTQSHILGKIKFNSAYKIIAADVNNNKSISNIDIIFMKRLILGLDTTFTGNRLWAFVDSAYTFADTTNPFPFKDSINFNNLTSNKPNQTFIGVKLGDVNYDWNPAIAKGGNSTPLVLTYNVISTKGKSQATDFSGTNLRNEENIKIPIKANNFKQLLGLQYTLHFDNSKYEFVGIENNKLGIEYNAKQSNQSGDISFVWTDSKTEERSLEDGSLMFELVLKTKLGIDEAITIYNLQLTTL